MNSLFRYFTGHTRDVAGKPQFKAGKTDFNHALDGVIKIVTVAVRVLLLHSFCSGEMGHFYLVRMKNLLYDIAGDYCSCCCA